MATNGDLISLEEEPLDNFKNLDPSHELTVAELQAEVRNLHKELRFFKTAYQEEILGLKKTIEHLKKNHDKNSLKKLLCKGVISRKNLEQHSQAIWGVDVDTKRRVIVTGSADKNVCLWDLDSGNLVDTLGGHTSGVICVKIHDGKIYSGGWDKHIRIWDLETRECEKILKGHSSAVRSLAVRNNVLVSCSSDKIILTWDITTGQCVQILKGHKGGVYSVYVDKDCQLLASGSKDHTIKMWQIDTGKCKRTLHGHTDVVYGIIFWENSLISCSGDATVRVWDITSGETLRILVHPASVNSVYYEHGLLFTCCSDDNIRMWDIGTGECLRVLKGHQDCVYGCHVADGTITSVSADNDAIIWKFL